MVNVYYRTYATKDDVVGVACVSPGLQRAFMEVLGLVDDAPRGADRAALERRYTGLAARCEKVLASRTAAEWKPIFDKRGVPGAAVRFSAELFDDEQARANGFFHDLPHPALGPVRVLAPPVKLDGGGLQLGEPCFRHPVRHEPASCHHHRQLPNRDGCYRDAARAEGGPDGARRGRGELFGRQHEPREGVCVEHDHRSTFQARAGKTGDSTSPTTFTVSAMHPKMSSAGSSTGTIFATGRPFLVITTGVRYFLTSSITRRQRALNSPAGIFFMVSPHRPWS